MNKGIKLASGDYLLFLNAGDYLVHYNIIKSLMNLFNNAFDVIYGNILCVNPKSNEYSIKAVGETLGINFFFVNTIPHQATFYKKEIFEKFGGYNENFKIISDNILNKKLICDYKVSKKYVNQIISVFLNDGISSTNKELDLQERKIFQAEYFSEEEIQEIEKQTKRSEIIKQRQQKKSILRFFAKILMKIHDLWIN